MGCGEKKEKSTTPPPVEKKQAMVEVVSKEADKKVDILIGGKLFCHLINIELNNYANGYLPCQNLRF